MPFVISSVITVLLMAGAIWLRNRWVIDDFNSYGVYGPMAGLYIYQRFGLRYIGEKNLDVTNEKVIPREKTKQIKRFGIKQTMINSAQKDGLKGFKYGN